MEQVIDARTRLQQYEEKLKNITCVIKDVENTKPDAYELLQMTTKQREYLHEMLLAATKQRDDAKGQQDMQISNLERICHHE
jgi:hypothetical protein